MRVDLPAFGRTRQDNVVLFRNDEDVANALQAGQQAHCVVQIPYRFLLLDDGRFQPA